MSNGKRWFVVATYAAAMAWVEAAVVFYLRTMVDRLEPYQPNPLPFATGFALAELVREAATLLMLLMVGILAGRTWRNRLGYFAIAFGVWDIFYYLFLKVLCGWPHSLLDWDVLFLIPMPWWGPVAAPVSIATLLIFWGTLVSQFDRQDLASHPRRKVWALNIAGVLLALYAFMADSLPVVTQGIEDLRNVLPTRFNWSLFCVALVLMAAPALENAFWLWRAKRLPTQILNYGGTQ